MGTGDGDHVGGGGVAGEQLGGQAARLRAEDQKVPAAVRRLEIAAGGPSGEAVQARRRVQPVELLPVVIDVQIDVRPVVKASSLQVAVVERETQRADEM